MTTLTITPNWKNKSARFKGTIAAGEHVAVSIANDDGSGSAYISSTTNLRLRVVDERGRTLAQFPMPPDEGETPDTWTSGTSELSCELNLNTVQMLAAVPPHATRQLLFVLDAYSEDTPEFTLYFKDCHEVTHWPRRTGEEEPTDLDNYKDIIADFREDIYGEGGFKKRVENAEASALASASDARAAAQSASGSQTSAANSASSAQSSAAAAGNSALSAQSAAQIAAESASLATASAIAKIRERTGNRLWHNVALSKNDRDQWVMDVDQEPGDDDGIFDAEVKALGTTAPRSLASRFADFVNVKDFGAKGDGTTDDTAAFEAIAASSFTALRIPAGSYSLRKRIIFSRPVSIIGDGAGVTTLTWADDSESSGIEIAPGVNDGKKSSFVQGVALVSAVSLSGAAADAALTVDYSECAKTQAGGTVDKAIYPRASMHATVMDVRVSNSSESGYTGSTGWTRGIEFVNCIGAVLDGCRINGCEDTANHVIRSECDSGVAFDGDYVAAPTQLYMSATSISCFGIGLYSHNAEGIYVNACEIVNCDVGCNVLNNGTASEGGGEPGFSVVQSHIAAREVALDLYGALTYSIQGCVLITQRWNGSVPTGGTVYGIRLGKASGTSPYMRGCESGIVSDNTIQHLYIGEGLTHNFVGILVGDSCKYNVIDGNAIWNAVSMASPRTSTGVLVDASGGTAPSDNIIGQNTYRDLTYGLVDHGEETRLAGDIANVRDFGARGNGIYYDDSAAFEMAARCAPTLGNIVTQGGPTGPEICRVRVPAGTYKISRWLDVGNRDVIWELDQGAEVGTILNGEFDTVNGAKYLNGVVVRPHERITRQNPQFCRDYACGFTVSTGGDFGDKTAPVTGCRSVAEYSVSYIDQVGIAGCAYSRPPMAIVVGSEDDGAEDGASVVYDTDGADGTVTFPASAFVDSDLPQHTYDTIFRRLRRGMVVLTRHQQKLIGILGSWAYDAASQKVTLKMQGMWYKYLGNGGGPAEEAAAADMEPNYGLDVGVINKVFGMNAVLELRENGYARDGIGIEVSARNYTKDSSEDVNDKDGRMWGILAGCGGSKMGQVGFMAKGGWRNGFAFHDNANKQGDCLSSWNSAGQRTFRVRYTGDIEIGRQNLQDHTPTARYIRVYTTGGAESDVFLEFVGGIAGTGGRGNLVIHGTTAFTQTARPAYDNSVSCGTENYRWKDVWTENGSVEQRLAALEAAVFPQQSQS